MPYREGGAKVEGYLFARLQWTPASGTGAGTGIDKQQLAAALVHQLGVLGRDARRLQHDVAAGGASEGERLLTEAFDHVSLDRKPRLDASALARRGAEGDQRWPPTP